MELFDNDSTDVDENMEDYDLMVNHVFGDDHELAYIDAYFKDVLSQK